MTTLVSSLQALELAAAAGDRFPGRSSLVVNGLGTVGAALGGSPFATTLYYGHPGWKALGAGVTFSPELIGHIERSRGVSLNGVFATDAGHILMSVVWASATVFLIERRFGRAAWCMGLSAVACAAGLMHGFEVVPSDVVAVARPAWRWVVAYLVMAGVFAIVPFIARPLRWTTLTKKRR